MAERRLTIRDRVITDDGPAYTIAEIGSNHQGDITTAERAIKAAADAGASAVKLQKRDNATLFTPSMADESYTGPHGYGPTYRLHREALEFTQDQHAQLLAFAHRHGVDYLCTAFDLPSLAALDAIGVDAIKIASGDMLSYPLVDAAFETGRPVIISSGGWDMAQVLKATWHYYTQHNRSFALLHCTAIYPTPYELTSLRVIAEYRDRIAGDEIVIGYSGHEYGWGILPAAYALGARVIEKHFTLDRTWKGADQHFSLTPADFREMTRALEQTRWALSKPGEKVAVPGEERAMAKLGKSLYAARDMPKGHVLTVDDIAMKSPMVPGAALPHLASLLVGGVLHRAKRRDEPLYERDHMDSTDGIE